MKQIRKNVFETNSSSTHSICISKTPAIIDKHIDFRVGEYGWENDCVYDTASYLYTAILCQDERDELLKTLKKILDKHNIEYSFEEPKYAFSHYSGEKYLAEGYIDHSYEAMDFVTTVLSDEDMLIRYLFGDSCIRTGNDNQDMDPSGCNIAYSSIWGYKDGKYVKMPNPYYDPEHYDYFIKGN